MKQLKRFFLYLILLVLLCVLIFLGRSFLYQNLIDPMTRIVWLVLRLLRIFDQEAVWSFLIILVIVVFLFFIPVRQEGDFHSAYPDTDNSEDRFTFWKRQFQEADQHASERQSLQHHLENLNHTIEELNDQDKENEPLLSISKLNPWQSALCHIKSVIARLFKRNTKFEDSRLEKDINQILDSMESRMEIQHDRSSRKPKNS